MQAKLEDTCGICCFFVLDQSMKNFGRCFLNPPTPIVRKDNTGKESVKTTRPIVYPTDYCYGFSPEGDGRRDAVSDRRNQSQRRD